MSYKISVEGFTPFTTKALHLGLLQAIYKLNANTMDALPLKQTTDAYSMIQLGRGQAEFTTIRKVKIMVKEV